MAHLVLVRHGQSVWNLQNRFTGWIDVSLSHGGTAEAQRAGERLAQEHFDVAFTSALLRAQDTLYEILKRNRFCEQYVRVHEHERDWYERFTPAPGDAGELKVYVAEALNERYYGDLQGMNKDLARKRFGADQVHRWRRSYDEPPPGGESLAMTAARVIPYYQERIVPQLRAGQRVLVSAHGNSLRALVMHIEALSPQQIVQREIPTGTPLVYEFTADLRLREHRVPAPGA